MSPLRLALVGVLLPRVAVGNSARELDAAVAMMMKGRSESWLRKE